VCVCVDASVIHNTDVYADCVRAFLSTNQINFVIANHKCVLLCKL